MARNTRKKRSKAGWFRQLVKDLTHQTGTTETNNSIMVSADTPQQIHRRSVYNDLKSAGLNRFDLAHAEPRHFSDYIHTNERVLAAIRGKAGDEGSVLLAATNWRILYLNLALLSEEVEEMSYSTVIGVQLRVNGFWVTVTLRTNYREFVINAINLKAARKFVDFIENATIDLPLMPRLG